ncbi:hypothetical protein, partial [Streptococcus pyogenes]
KIKAQPANCAFSEVGVSSYIFCSSPTVLGVQKYKQQEHKTTEAQFLSLFVSLYYLFWFAKSRKTVIFIINNKIITPNLIYPKY